MTRLTPSQRVALMTPDERRDLLHRFGMFCVDQHNYRARITLNETELLIAIAEETVDDAIDDLDDEEEDDE